MCFNLRKAGSLSHLDKLNFATNYYKAGLYIGIFNSGSSKAQTNSDYNDYLKLLYDSY